MSPIAENMPSTLIPGELPGAVGLSPSTPKATKPAIKPEQAIPSSLKAGVVGNPLAADIGLDDETPAIAPVAIPSREDRKSPRLPVPSARQSCELRVGSDVLPASLMDRSAGGFAIVIDRTDGLKAGTKVELATDLGRFKVRVVYINKIARPKDAPTQSDLWFRVGLKKARSFRLF